jgi:hypothetical protein
MMSLTNRVGLAGVGTSLVVAGALLVGGSAGAAVQAKQAPTAPNITGSTVTIPVGSHGYATVDCPAGTVVTGGGGQTGGYQTFITDSYRTSNGWAVRATNTDTAPTSVTAVAVCAGTS